MAPSRSIGILCALPGELGSLAERAHSRRTHLGLELLSLRLSNRDCLACVAGVGKVLAARAAAALISAGAVDGLLVVGTCGGLRQSLAPGTLVHCTTAFQVDLASRASREVEAHSQLRRVWREVAPGEEGWFLTADRPVLSWWRRLRLARAFAGPCVAEMETAAAAVVARHAGVPWAGLRAVTDRATPGGALSFRWHYPEQAGRAADSVPALVARWPRIEPSAEHT